MEIGDRRIHGSNDGVHLGGIAGAEDRQDTQHRINGGKEMPLFPQAVFDVIHRTANPVPFRVSFPEMDRQGHLSKLGAHSQQRAAPHPEHRTGAADGNGTRHTRDVAGAHGAGQRGAHRLKGGHGAIGSVFFAEHSSNGDLDGVGKFADLQKARANAQEQAYADDAHHGGHAPDELVDRLIDGRDRFNHIFPHPLLNCAFPAEMPENKHLILPQFLRTVK